jgi:hypothetical protein
LWLLLIILLYDRREGLLERRSISIPFFGRAADHADWRLPALVEDQSEDIESVIVSDNVVELLLFDRECDINISDD